MNDLTNNQDLMKNMLLSFAQVINEQQAKMPAGCISESIGGVFNARSIMDVNGLTYDIDAPDGFIRNGLLVRFHSQRKAIKGDKFNGYKVVFELNGIYNGVFVVFTKTEFEYKLYLNAAMWNIESHEVIYKPITECKSEMTRVYKVPMVRSNRTNEFECTDRKNTLENKVGMALSSKLNLDYTAHLGELVYDEDEKQFVSVEESAI